jgi:hypothetical protein
MGIVSAGGHMASVFDCVRGLTVWTPSTCSRTNGFGSRINGAYRCRCGLPIVDTLTSGYHRARVSVGSNLSWQWCILASLYRTSLAGNDLKLVSSPSPPHVYGGRFYIHFQLALAQGLNIQILFRLVSLLLSSRQRHYFPSISGWMLGPRLLWTSTNRSPNFLSRTPSFIARHFPYLRSKEFAAPCGCFDIVSTLVQAAFAYLISYGRYSRCYRARCGCYGCAVAVV